MATIHWCGSGLSSGPGLRRLIDAGLDVTVWTIEPERARALVGDRPARIADYSAGALETTVRAGDVVVSMLPPDLHAGLARIALRQRAHFACSSYVSPEIRALDAAARKAGVALVCEAGLDPGVDHLMSHDLVEDLRASGLADAPGTTVSFFSFCGGFPAAPDAFRYKFSWSPLGVLKALRAPARAIRHFVELTVEHPWEAVGRYSAPLPAPETFEVYPNRDSLPFLTRYDFDPAWRVEDFIRGTIRPMGWADAWAPVFAAVADKTDGADLRLAQLSERLRSAHSYAPGEADRVVLTVSLAARREGAPVFDRCWALDARGDARGTAMARMVSGLLSLTVEAILAREIPAGLHAGTADDRLRRRWLDALRTQAGVLVKTDRLA